MPSSTLHSSGGVPWLAVRLLVVALSTLAVSACYSLRLNPEIAFFRQSHFLKAEWGRELDLAYTNKVVIYGGSSCGTSIDGEGMLRRHNLPVLNLGLGAGMGMKVLTRYAQRSVRSGDTLLISAEPGLLLAPPRAEALGVQFSLAIGEPSLLRDPRRVNWPSALIDLRPGGYHVFTLLGKALLRQPLYGYSRGELHAGGWHAVAARHEVEASPEIVGGLSPEARAWLADVRDWCAARNVRVAYVLPWQFSPPEKLARFQQGNLRFLREISEVLPVLKDPAIGAYSVREQFADTPLHLTAEGAALRTDALARQIKTWETWSFRELTDMIEAHH